MLWLIWPSKLQPQDQQWNGSYKFWMCFCIFESFAWRPPDRHKWSTWLVEFVLEWKNEDVFFLYVESFDGKVPRLDLSGVHNKGLDDLVDCWHWLHLSWAFLTFCWCMMLELTDSPFDVHDRKSQRFRQSDEARMDKGTWKAFERICSWEPGSLQASDSMLPMAQKCWITPFFVSVCLCLYRFLEFSCEMSWSGLALHLPAQRYVFFLQFVPTGFLEKLSFWRK